MLSYWATRRGRHPRRSDLLLHANFTRRHRDRSLRRSGTQPYGVRPMVIAINLDDLTQAHIDQAAPHIRQCTYSSPCIIGAMMTPEQREVADQHRSEERRVGQECVSTCSSWWSLEH